MNFHPNLESGDNSNLPITPDSAELNHHFAAVFLFRALVFGLCSYGLLYYAYKYYQPTLGGEDYFRYVKMYFSPFDHRVPDPYRTRRLSALLTHLVYRAGIYYPNRIAFEQSLEGQHIFFASLCTNALALWGTAMVCAYTTRLRGAVPILAGALVFLGFGTQLFVLTGLTEGPSWFLMALGFFFYSRQKFFGLWIVMLLSVLQRETIPVVFGCFALVDAGLGRWRDQNSGARASQITFVVALAAFGIYLWLRTLDPASGRGTGQLNLHRMGDQLRHFRPGAAWLFQVVLSQNLLFLWALTGILGRRILPKNPDFALPNFTPHLLLAVAALTLGGIATGIGNNAGRILTILTPILAALIAPAIARLKL